MIRLMWQEPVGSAGEKLSTQLKEHLISQFALDPPMVDRMRVSEKAGPFSSRQTKFIRIYDPALIERGASAAPGYDALDQDSDSRRALLFQGRVDATGRICLTDERSSIALFPMQ
jgi:hypothetical protein